MRFWFDADLRGSFREPKSTGRCGRFDLSLRAEAEDVSRFARERTARLTGTVTMEGVAVGVPVEGTLRVDPLGDREVVYDLSFRVEAARYRFLGRSAIRLLDPVVSATTVVGRIEQDGVTLADAECRIGLVDLARVLASFGLSP